MQLLVLFFKFQDSCPNMVYGQAADISEPLSDDPEVRMEPKMCAVATQADDPIEKLTSYYSYWLRLCKAVAWMRRLADWIRSKKCQTGYLQATGLQAVECSILQWLQLQIDWHCNRAVASHMGGVWESQRLTVPSGQRNTTCCRSATLC